MIRGASLAIILAIVAAPLPARADRALPTWEAYRIQRTFAVAVDAWARGHVQAAEEAAAEVVGHDPANVEAWRLLATARLALGRAGEAHEAAEPLAVLAADDPEACLLRGRIAVEVGGSEEAVAAYRRAAELLPEDPRPALGRALVAARLEGDFEAMEQHLRAARALDPDQPGAELPLRAAWAPLAESPEFLEILRRLLQEEPAP